MKLCGKMVEAGQAYSTANKLLLSGLAELCTNQTKDSVITVSSSSMHLKKKKSLHPVVQFTFSSRRPTTSALFPLSSFI